VVKRTYKHIYNAYGDVGVIFGAKTNTLQYIGVGNSSVFLQLQEKVPVWGKSIENIECANHTCKCLRSNLEMLVIEKPH
jgi:hypothetical protein